MAKIVTEGRTDGSLTVRLLCPACGCEHSFKSHPSGRMDVRRKTWGWNLSHDRPTFSPSLVFDTDDKGGFCHSWIREGRMIFLEDSTAHDKGGLTLPMPDVVAA